MANRVEDIILTQNSVSGRMIWSQPCRILARPHWANGSGHPYLKLFVLDKNGMLVNENEMLFKWDKKSPVAVSWSYHFSDSSIDPDGHLAFCAGTMPPHVYADWLEERLSDVPVELLALLRERMGDGN